MRLATAQITPGDTLEVWFDGRLVGHLVRQSASVLEIAFRYAEGWTAASGAFPVSLSMPLERRDHAPAVAYPWFMNLLPEGRALQVIGSILKVSEIDVFAMLEEMGGDLPGALEIRREGAAAAELRPSHRKLTETELAECIRRLPQRPLLVGEDGITMSAAGAQEKLPVVRFKDGTLGLALNGAASTHILKPASAKLRDSVANEAYCLRLAEAVKLSAAPVEIGRAEDVEYLLVRRYDRQIEGKSVRRVHQEDLCQASGFPPYLKYEWNREVAQRGPTLKICMDTLARTPAPGANKIRFVDALLLNVLTGNVDAHAKNYSLLIRSSSDIALAPLYDVMNGDIYPDVTRNMAMKIADQQRGAHVYGRHWDRFAAANGLSATQVRKRVKTLSAAVLKAAPEIAERMGAEHGRPEVYKEISGYVTDYCRRMLANLDRDPPPEHETGAEVDEGELTIAEAEQATLSPPAIDRRNGEEPAEPRIRSVSKNKE